MKKFKYLSLMFCAVSLFAFHPLQAEEILLSTSIGENVRIEIHPDDTFLGVMEQLATAIASVEEPEQQIAQGRFFFGDRDESAPEAIYAFNFMIANQAFIQPLAGRSAAPGTRNYYAQLTDAEKNDIRYILTTLGSVPLIFLKTYESSLNQAGDRINHIHPLKFLEHVFTSEELKVAIRNVKSQGSWVWGDFLGGLGESLNEESNYHNMRDEFVVDFASRVKIDSALVLPLIRQRNWSTLVETLISKIPRQGDTKRYNM